MLTLSLSLSLSLSAVLITVGYEFTIYTTSEGQGLVELSVVIFDPPTGGAPRQFALSVDTQDGSAGMW